MLLTFILMEQFAKKKSFMNKLLSDFEMKVREAYLLAFITTVLTPASVPQSTNNQPTSGE